MTLPRAVRYGRSNNRLPTPPHNRVPANLAPIGPHAVRAAYGAHKDSDHHGRLSTTCPTCRRYLAGIAVETETAALTARQRAQPPTTPPTQP